MSLQQPLSATTRSSQLNAANPTAHVWVNANAGSGKTHVLMERVLRLMLSGTRPEKILCLTYTKAAASEMQNRIFDRLRHWIKLSETDLFKALNDLLGRSPTEIELKKARKMFAEALETPGGLKIQTLHAFCERVLQQFPIEANVPAEFNTYDEHKQNEVLALIYNEILVDIKQNPHSEKARKWETLLNIIGSHKFRDVILEGVKSSDKFPGFSEENHEQENKLRQKLGLSPSDTEEDLHEQIINDPHFPSSQWPHAAQTIIEYYQSNNMQPNQSVSNPYVLLEASQEEDISRKVAAYIRFFSTSKNEMRKKILLKEIANKHPELNTILEREKDRVEHLLEKLKAIALCKATLLAYYFIKEALTRYTLNKNMHSALDFKDLITKTADMFERISAEWVLFKLDQSIEHILIDEAQDTSQHQWKIVEKLTEEFYAGKTAQNINRTLFVVGDEKQSIYSFQGANPTLFGNYHQRFHQKIHNAGKTLTEINLNTSFRSAPLILEAVDQVFKSKSIYEGVVRTAINPTHTAHKHNHHGIIEIWDPVETINTSHEDNEDDSTAAFLSSRDLAQRIATQIQEWMTKKVKLPSREQPISAGDILILVRSRNAFFNQLISSLNEKNIPTSGADKLSLTDHIAIQDCLALADVLISPDDDLALATILKSPIADFSEEEIFELCYQRKGTIWQSLEAKQSLNTKYHLINQKLSSWKALATALRPFDFFATLFSKEGFRKLYLSHYGSEVEDLYDAFLSLCLSYEQIDIATLPGFLGWLRASEKTEVKREMEGRSDQVRIMTVHGSKGLEAPIVILPDTFTNSHNNKNTNLLSDKESENDYPLILSNCFKNNILNDHNDKRKKHDLHESRRLLYVAMTRAEDMLLICGHTKKKKKKEGDSEANEKHWYHVIRNALESELTEIAQIEGLKQYRYKHAPTNTLTYSEFQQEKIETPVSQVPEWVTTPLPSQNRLKTSLKVGSPSQLAGDKNKSSIQSHKSFGIRVHKALEQVIAAPPLTREQVLAAWLISQHKEDQEETEKIHAQLQNLLSSPATRFLFTHQGATEVDISGFTAINQTAINHGRIDWLIDNKQNNELWIVDFKTSHQPPKPDESVPQSIQLQMEAYANLLKPLFLNKKIRLFIVWTQNATVTEVFHTPPANTSVMHDHP